MKSIYTIEKDDLLKVRISIKGRPMRDFLAPLLDENPEGDALADVEGRLVAAQYVRDIVVELSALARRNGLVTMAYLLDMARLEAESLLNGQ